MAFDREAAKAEGYTEDEINAYLQAEAEKQKKTVVADVGEPPAPTTQIQQVEPTASSIATTAALGAAPYVVPTAGALGAAIGGKALYNRWDASAKAAQSLADAKMASEQGIAAREAARQAARAPLPTGPVAPTGTPTYNVPTSNVPQPRAPLPTTGPVAPTSPAPVAQAAQVAEQAAVRAPTMLDKTTAMIRQLAANKVVQNLGKGMTGLQMATYSPELGPQTPQTGRMRGSEINPMTGRPWTKEQLAQYSANPSLFDSQLPPAQMPR
jgi:hypothetical protein